jgi:tetratricopeptide (TPR) repeat protein
MDINNTIRSAISYYQTGDFQQAKESCEKVLRVQPDNANMLHLLGLVLYQLGHYDLSIQYIQQALAFEPYDAGLYYDLGNVLEDKGQLSDAIISYQKALQINPDYPEAYNNLGFAFRKRGRIDEAISCYQKAIEISPMYYDAYYNLAMSLQENEQIDEAISCYQKAIEISPDYPEVYNNLGFAFQEKGQLDRAIDLYRRALEIHPSYPEAQTNLGNALMGKGLINEAIACYKEALRLNPDYVEAYTNLGNAYQQKGSISEAITCYQKALRINPDFASAHWNLSLVYLLSGNFEQGWNEYPWFWHLKDVVPRKFSRPPWDGSIMKDNKILLYAEEGYGDTIHFFRYIPLVAERCAKVIIECQEELISLVRNIDGVNQVIAQGEQIPEHDVHCSLLMLPAIFKTTFESIPAKVPYIPIDPGLTKQWQDMMQDDNEKIKIGLVWAGGHKEGTLNYRSCSLEMFLPFIKLDGITFYSLQKGEAAEQTENLPEGIKLVNYMEEIRDFSDTAALIENLDLVISVDTSVAHLAGALGKPVWLLLHFVPSWRWLLGREDSPWYPTMRLFRQPAPGDWGPVIERVLRELEMLVRGCV